MSIIVVFYSRYSQQSLDFLQEIEKISEMKISISSLQQNNKTIL